MAISTRPNPTEFKPFVPPEESPRELTISAVVTGTCLGLIFAASSLYLVLKVGMTVSASIPVAVLAITLFRAFSRITGFRRATILENNIVQTSGSAGESIAFGVGVTMPALLLLGYGMDLGRVMVVSILGGLLGILAMIPLRRAFIVNLHGRPGEPGKLLYPEGTACAQVLISGEKGGTTGATVFTGFGLAFLHKFVTEGMALFTVTAQVPIAFINRAAAFASEMASELLGVGYIIGVRTAGMMMGGAVLGYLVIIPIIYFVGENAPNVVPPGDKPIGEMSISEIRNNYLLFIGAGTVATAGIISMLKTLPMIVRSFRSTVATMRGGTGEEAVKRTDRDIPMTAVLFGTIALLILLTLFLAADVGLGAGILGALLVVLFGFLFVTVSARLTGEIGSSSNPISGMTTATLMVTCLIFLALGMTSSIERVLALSIAAVVCIASSNGGTVAQALKTGFLVGGTPRNMQYAIIVGAFVSALVIGATLIYGLNRPGTVYSRKAENVPNLTLTPEEMARLSQSETYEGKTYRVFDTRNEELRPERGVFTPREEVTGVKEGRYLVDPETGRLEIVKDDTIMGRLHQRDDGTLVERKFDAPKTQVMGIVINGVLKQDLNWTMVAIGAMIAIMLELLGVSALAFAVGLYVPIQYSSPIFIGGVIRWLVDRRIASRAAADIAAAGDDPEARARAEVEAIRKSETSPGVLMASGYIAGGSLAGVMLAFFAFSDTLPRDLGQFQYPRRTLGTAVEDPAVKELASRRTVDSALGGGIVGVALNDLPSEARRIRLLMPAARIVAERELSGGSETEREALASAIAEQNQNDVPYYWVRVPAGTELALPRGETYTASTDTTLGQVAADRLGVAGRRSRCST